MEPLAAPADLIHTHHSALVGVLVAAGVVGPGAVALRVQEPAAALGADLGDHLCRSRRHSRVQLGGQRLQESRPFKPNEGLGLAWPG